MARTSYISMKWWCPLRTKPKRLIRNCKVESTKRAIYQISFSIHIVYSSIYLCKKKFEDTKGVIRRSKSSWRQLIIFPRDNVRLCSRPTSLLLGFYSDTKWNDSLRVDILLLSDTLPSFQSNQSLLFLVNTEWLVEKPVNRCSIDWIITANSNTMGVTCGAWTANPSRSHELTTGFKWGSYCPIFGLLCNAL